MLRRQMLESLAGAFGLSWLSLGDDSSSGEDMEQSGTSASPSEQSHPASAASDTERETVSIDVVIRED